jgi:hypothetical protein
VGGEAGDTRVALEVDALVHLTRTGLLVAGGGVDGGVAGGGGGGGEEKDSGSVG